MTRAEQELTIKQLRNSILGVKLLAYEMSEEVSCIRGLLQQGRHEEIGIRLTRLDELIKPLMLAVRL
jgi:hypothetical protein